MNHFKINKFISNKILTIIFILLFILNPLLNVPAISESENNTIEVITINNQLNFSNISISSDQKFTLIGAQNISTELMNNNGVISSNITKTIIIPRDSIIKNISYSYLDIQDFTIEHEFKLLPQIIRYSTNRQLMNLSLMTSDFSNSEYVYSNQSFDYSIGSGISNGEPSLFITLQCNPISYNPNLKRLSIASSMNYSIRYETLKNNIETVSDVDLVIISPQSFQNRLEPLVEHKNNVGIKTIIKTTEDIYSEFDGRDDAEEIKLFIKYALEQWNIKYVLLVGGLIGQTDKWHVPVRYSNLHDRSFWNDSYVTDLYFADIYRYNTILETIEFDDWDSNQNNVFAEWSWIYDQERGWWYDLDKKDNLDLYPDVAIGRLACRNRREVENVVNKIIHYETNSFNQDWFKSVILCGGDTVPYSDGVCEGEIENEYAASYLEPLGFETKKLWVSTGTLKGPLDVIREMRKGAGFLYLTGHGTPREWCTHPVSDDSTWIDLYSYAMDQINNNYKLPICVVGGCHNSQFDVGLSRIPNGASKYGLSYFLWNEGIDCFFKWTWVSSCWSWNLISQKNDGCIAVIGNTGLGWGVGGESSTEYNEGYLTTRFFQIYASLTQQEINQLGIVHCETLNNYISHFSANNNLLDRKTVEEWVLLGDPSLQIGGYPN